MSHGLQQVHVSLCTNTVLWTWYTLNESDLVKDEVHDVVVVVDGENGSDGEHRVWHPPVKSSLVDRIWQVPPQRNTGVLLEDTHGAFKCGGLHHGLSKEWHVEKGGALWAVDTRNEGFGVYTWKQPQRRTYVVRRVKKMPRGSHFHTGPFKRYTVSFFDCYGNILPNTPNIPQTVTG